MEKEMKKLLLVAVSVGVFLLVTITVAIVVLTPKTQPQETAFSSSIPVSQGRNLPDIMNNMPMQVEIPVTPAEIRNEQIQNNIDIFEQSIAADSINGERLTIQIPRPSSAAVPDVSAAPQTPAVRQPPASSTTQPAATATRPATSAPRPAATVTPSAPQVRPAATPSAAARPSPARTINDFWIQTGAFSAMVRAEDAKDLLASKGLVSIIENREINGRTWYRVRLGPYTSEREANHWLEIVKAIDGFGESQVRQTVRQQ